MQYKIGIDSGGTHITAQAYTMKNERICESTAGPGNSLIDLHQTKQNIQAVLDELFHVLPVEGCSLILAGVAGSKSAGNQEELAAFIENTFHRPAVVISDAELAMLKGLQGSDGILVIAGTGSIVLGQFDQTSYRAGGWGHLLGDQGSAYDLVRQSFKGMLEEADQGKIGDLTNLILPIMGAENVFEAVQLFNQFSRDKVASYAKEFTKQGGSNESLQTIMIECGYDLAQQVLAILNQVGSKANKSKIAITGSVLTHNLIVQKSFEQTITQKYSEVTFVPLLGPNSSGVLYYKGAELS